MKAFLLFLAAAIQTGAALAVDDVAFPSFVIGGERYVFPDFRTAKYRIVYDAQAKKASYEADIELELNEPGHVVFDAVTAPTLVALDGADGPAPEVTTPDGSGTFRATRLGVAAGRHSLRVAGEIRTLVSFGEGNVRSAFWCNDLSNRMFLERYLPASFEYDRVKMEFDVQVSNALVPHAVIANGAIAKPSENRFQIAFPDSYNVSAIFFHLLPESRIVGTAFDVPGAHGRQIPAFVYFAVDDDETPSPSAPTELKNRYQRTVETVISKLQRAFGGFLHEKIIIYDAESGGFPGLAGMEYAGATMTTRWAVEHELTHSYFGRGIFPANGNAGWLDEAITTWQEDGASEDDPSSIPSPRSMFAHSPYMRGTDSNAYSLGARFIEKLASRLKRDGRLRFGEFLKEMISGFAGKPYTNESFWKLAEQRYGFDLLSLAPRAGEFDHIEPAPRAHRRFTDEQLVQML